MTQTTHNNDLIAQRNELVHTALAAFEVLLRQAINQRKELLKSLQAFQAFVKTAQAEYNLTSKSKNKNIEAIYKARKQANHRAIEQEERVVKLIAELQQYVNTLTNEKSEVYLAFNKLSTEYETEIKDLKTIIALLKDHQKKVFSTEELTAIMQRFTEYQTLMYDEGKDVRSTRLILEHQSQIEKRIEEIGRALESYRSYKDFPY